METGNQRGYWVPISASDCKHMPSDIRALLFALQIRRYKFLGILLRLIHALWVPPPLSPRKKNKIDTRIAVSNLACHLPLKLECRISPKLL